MNPSSDPTQGMAPTGPVYVESNLSSTGDFVMSTRNHEAVVKVWCSLSAVGECDPSPKAIPLNDLLIHLNQNGRLFCPDCGDVLMKFFTSNVETTTTKVVLSENPVSVEESQ